MAIRTGLKSGKNTEVIDLGLGEILRELNIADNLYTKVGLPSEGEVKGGKKKGSGEDTNDMAELIDIGFYNEFGAPKAKVPERSFIRTSFDENLQVINELKVKLYKKIIDGKMTAARAIGIIGEVHTNHIKRKIRDIMEPANAPSTMARKKGVNNPLIDNAQMLNSIQHIEEKI